MFFSSFQVSCISNIYRHDWGLRVAVVFFLIGDPKIVKNISHMVMFKRKTIAFFGSRNLKKCHICHNDNVDPGLIDPQFIERGHQIDIN